MPTLSHSAAAAELRERADRCLWLARSVADEEASERLRLMAAEYRDQAAKLESRSARREAGAQTQAD